MEQSVDFEEQSADFGAECDFRAECNFGAECGLGGAKCGLRQLVEAYGHVTKELRAQFSEKENFY